MHNPRGLVQFLYLTHTIKKKRENIFFCLYRQIYRWEGGGIMSSRQNSKANNRGVRNEPWKPLSQFTFDLLPMARQNCLLNSPSIKTNYKIHFWKCFCHSQQWTPRISSPRHSKEREKAESFQFARQMLRKRCGTQSQPFYCNLLLNTTCDLPDLKGGRWRLFYQIQTSLGREDRTLDTRAWGGTVAQQTAGGGVGASNHAHRSVCLQRGGDSLRPVTGGRWQRSRHEGDPRPENAFSSFALSLDTNVVLVQMTLFWSFPPPPTILFNFKLQNTERQSQLRLQSPAAPGSTGTRDNKQFLYSSTGFTLRWLSPPLSETSELNGLCVLNIINERCCAMNN